MASYFTIATNCANGIKIFIFYQNSPYIAFLVSTLTQLSYSILSSLVHCFYAYCFIVVCIELLFPFTTSASYRIERTFALL